jgi:hypothetical protein
MHTKAVIELIPEKHRLCNCCHNNTIVLTMRLGTRVATQTQTTTVALCLNCRLKLKNILEKDIDENFWEYNKILYNKDIT